jgi:hypothetical protein
MKQNEIVINKPFSYTPRKGYNCKICSICKGAGMWIDRFQRKRICLSCEGNGLEWRPKKQRNWATMHDGHSPLCKTDREVAQNHNQTMLIMTIGTVIEFIENAPPNIVIRNYGEPEEKPEMRFCRYCGAEMIQFQIKIHKKGCIVRQLRGMFRMWHQHLEWHDYSPIDHYKWDYKFGLRVRWLMRWLDGVLP